ncbi:MAG: bifunctional hydroxymethylpyrimidine kinase/phosphomethylpyrimidine kinase [Hyphomicrobium sp.]|jgi:hydroxymethylpyrimidine/phosphomethylpyrimidine kinase
MASDASPAIALTIAGSDSSGGAGIQADLKTFTALGVYGASVLTAITAQNTLGVQAVHCIPPDVIREQIKSVASDLDVRAVKTGMLGDRTIVETVAAALKQHMLRPLVVDPVMVATSGDVLLEPDAIEAVVKQLIPLADIITPNLHEAARLLDTTIATSVADMADQGRRLLALGAKHVLIKGGHQTGRDSIDVLVGPEHVETFTSARIETRNTHGTGCTLSAAIAASLAKGGSLRAAVGTAKTFVSRAIESGAALRIGHGAGPIDHLYDLRHG